MKAGCPGDQDVDDLVGVAPGGGLRHAEPGPKLGERLVLPQVDQSEECLLETAQQPPPCALFTPSGVKQPGSVLNQLMGHVEHGRIRNQRSLRRWCGEWNHHTNDGGFAMSPAPHLTSSFIPQRQDERGSLTSIRQR